MKRPENILETKEYIEPYTFENDQEAILFYAYLEQEKYINSLEEQLTLTSVSQQRELLNFLKWYDLDVEYNSKQTHKQLILSYEQKFNCG